MKSAVINGVPCMVAESERLDRTEAPVGFPYRYQSRHSCSDLSIPTTIEHAVMVNYWGTIFSSLPLLQDGEDFANIGSLSFQGVEMESAPEVCPDCGLSLAYGKVSIAGNTVYAGVTCSCGYVGREEYELSSFTAWVGDFETDGEISEEGIVDCPSCGMAVGLPMTAQEFDAALMSLEADCSFCGAEVEVEVSCNYFGKLPLPIPLT